MESFKVGTLVEAPLLENNDRWVDGLIIGTNHELKTVDLIILNAEKENVVPLAYEVSYKSLRLNPQKEVTVTISENPNQLKDQKSNKTQPKVKFYNLTFTVSVWYNKSG